MLPIGCFSIDKLLGGGLPRKVITQFYGPSGSGKTNVCIQAMLTNAIKGKKVLFIDTEGGFNEKRVKQVCGDHSEKVLKSTTLAEVMDFDSQANVMRDLNDAYDLIIVDSITNLYRLEREEENVNETNKELSKQLAFLLKYARERDIPVLVTNQVYSNFETGAVNPVGGDVLKYSSKVIVELQKTDDGARKALLRKHLFKKEGEEAGFEIVGSGLKDY